MATTSLTAGALGTRGAAPAALDAATMCEAFQITAAEARDRPALRLKGSDVEITFAEYAERVRRLAAGFAALGLGRGETIGFMLVNRPEFIVCDCAAMHLGATCFSIYNTSSPEQIEFLLADAGNRILVTEQAFLERLAPVAGRIEHLVVIDGDPRGGDAPTAGALASLGLSLDDLIARGDEDFDFETSWRAVEPDDVLCLIYTSGTTGPPKGVQLTHGNLVAEWRAVDAVYPTTPGGRTISFLPSAHIADRWAHLYGQMIYGHTVYCCPDPRDMVAFTSEVRPTAWGGVPRIWEKLKAALEAAFAAEQDEQRRTTVEWALKVGRQRVRLEQGGDRVPSELRADCERADELVGRPLRERLGVDQVQWFAVGAAPTPPEVLEFFAAFGIEIAELWGLSETAAVATFNPPGAVRFGTVGPPLPGVEVTLAQDGEILVRGPIVMKGYRGRDDLTAEVIDPDGWLYTGDVGEFDEAGYLKIVDRKKELIINAAGKNMAPANIEAKLKSASPLIGQAAAIGDRRPYNVALIVLDPDAAAPFAAQHGLPDASPAALAHDERVQAAVAEGVERANAQLSRVEQVKKFTVLPVDWEAGGDELTPTMKLKRKPIAEKYAGEIEALYTG
jgi:long-subunit acyl-CoA synthetase (AMP-forming)